MSIEIDPSTVLQKPADTQALFRRMGELSRLQLPPSFAQRAELAGLIMLLTEGSVTAHGIWQLLLEFYGYSPVGDSDAAWLEPVCQDQITAWKRLNKTVAGEPIPELSPEEQVEECLRSIKRTLEIFPGWKVKLPGRLVSEIENNFASKLLPSPFGIGEALARRISAFGNEDQGAHFLGILAELVTTAVSDHERASEVSEKMSALGKVDVLWQILKGMTFGILPETHSHNVPAMLSSSAVDRIAAALTSGLDTLRANGAQIPQWGGCAGAKSAEVTITDLIERLHERVADENARKSRSQNYR